MKKIVLSMLAALAVSGTAMAQTQLTVTHGPVPKAIYIDLGAAGDSVGDQRFWQFNGQTTDKQVVITDWVMTTTGRGTLVKGMESRLTNAVFSFGQLAKDTILLQGIGLYPMAGSTLKSDAVLQRSVIGGTGKYAGAIGTVTSTHFPDNTWQHVFNLR
jgi:hypothetical protein